MKTTRENIKNRIEEINKELEKITKLDKKFPQGELQCFKNENRYKWKVKEENGIRYLPKTERNQAEILALKKYYEYRKKELESEAAGWEAYLKKTDKMKINSEHLLNHPEYGKLLAKNFRPLDKELERWQEEPYEKCTKHPENLLVQGTHGKMLRSKSEAIIDRMLYQNKIPFHYEEKLVLDGIILYPDFVIRHPFTGQYFYWEHFGMMDNPDYCNHACDKIKLYCRHGIIPSVNLILTYETKQCPLNADKVEMILQEYFDTTGTSRCSTTCLRSTTAISGTLCRYSSITWTGNTPRRSTRAIPMPSTCTANWRSAVSRPSSWSRCWAGAFRMSTTTSPPTSNSGARRRASLRGRSVSRGRSPGC